VEKLLHFSVIQQRRFVLGWAGKVGQYGANARLVI